MVWEIACKQHLRSLFGVKLPRKARYVLKPKYPMSRRKQVCHGEVLLRWLSRVEIIVLKF